MRKYLLSLVVVLLFASCGGKNSISGFIKLCKSENVSEINQTILDMDKNKVLDIYKELCNFHYKEEDGGKVNLEKKYQNKCQALLYMHFGLSYLEQTGQLSFTDEQKSRLEDIRFEAGVMLLPLTLKGDVDFNRVKGQYEELYTTNAEATTTEGEVYSKEDIEKHNEEGPQVNRSITVLDGEWFCRGYAPFRIVLKKDNSCVCDGTPGTYSINNGTIKLSLNDGKSHTGLVKDDGYSIYLDFLSDYDGDGVVLGFFIEASN